jgi:hypothetical protein
MTLGTRLTTAVLSLTLVAAAPAFAQEQHEEERKAQSAQEEKARPAQEEKKAQPKQSPKQGNQSAARWEKTAKPAGKNAKPEAKNAKQENNRAMPAEKSGQQPQQRASGNGGGRIPEANFKAHFGQQHTFRVSQSDYSNHRFQYGGYWFGFQQPWPSNWLYSQDVYVIEINGVYYLCNASFPGVNLELSFAL